METLFIEATTSSPLVELNPDAGKIRLVGESYPENALEFYRPILTWVDQFLQRDARPLSLDLHLTYLNTSSIKSLMDLLDALEEAFREGREIQLDWRYDEENERALELAEEFKEDLSLPFNLVPVKG